MNKKLIGRAILKDNYGKRGYEPIFFVCRTVNTGTRRLHVQVVDGYYSYGSEWQIARGLFAETAQAELSENDIFVCEKCKKPQCYCSANLDKYGKVILTCQYCGGEVKCKEIPKD